jgi:hypothetical protein
MCEALPQARGRACAIAGVTIPILSHAPPTAAVHVAPPEFQNFNLNACTPPPPTNPRYGLKWVRATDTAQVGTLRSEIDKYRGLLQDAANSDNQVRSKLLKNQDEIAQLGCTRAQLNGAMPAAGDIATVSQAERQHVESLVVATSGLLSVRDACVAELDAAAAALDVKQPLLRDHARKMSEGGNFEIDDKDALFAATLQPLNEVADRVRGGVTAQADLLEKLTAANEACVAWRAHAVALIVGGRFWRGLTWRHHPLLPRPKQYMIRYVAKQSGNPVEAQRGKMLTGLQKGVSKYREIEGNIGQGRSFYSQFRDRVNEVRS